jgi:transcriptional regulator NrdR family protein
MNKNSIQRFISHLKVTEKVKNQEDFALSIGYKSKSAFSQAISKEPISQETINKINNVYPEFKTWEVSVISSEDVQKYIFEKLPIEEKLNMLHKQNLDLKEENENLKDMIDGLSLTMEISLAPILRHLKIAKDKEPDLKQNKSSIN